MNAQLCRLTPLILSGGSGTRLWPLSRPECPKQFIALTGDETMLQLTLARTEGLSGLNPPVIVANAAHADLIEAQIEGDAAIILEPCARNTAPAIALVALLAADPAAALLVMPSDHVITNVSAFHDAITRALPLVQEGWLITLGITPDAPETGYGYIALGEALAEGVQRVERFVEKPDQARAEVMLAAGNHVWNAGIFLFRADAYLAALEQFRPDMMAAARAAVAHARREGRRVLPDRDAFEGCPPDSIDYAVMERAEQVACVPVDMGWSDVGSWDALHAISVKDDAGNVTDGSAALIETRGCLVRSDGIKVSLVGAEDLIVVASGDEILIVPRGKSQLVKKAAEAAAIRGESGQRD